MATHARAELGLQGRMLDTAPLLCKAATRIEHAAARPVGDAWDHARNGVEPLARAVDRARGSAAV